MEDWIVEEAGISSVAANLAYCVVDVWVDLFSQFVQFRGLE